MKRETEESFKLEDLRREMRRLKLRTTVCTPSFLLSRRSPGVSIIMGWAIFVMFITIVVFIFISMSKVVNSPDIPQTFKTVLIGLLSMGIFISMVSVFIVDTLTSLEEKHSQAVASLKKIEEHAYNQYQLQRKLIQKGK